DHKMQVLLATGQLLMESGANTNRIYRDMLRTAKYMGIPERKFHLHIMYTTLMLNVSDDEHSYTSFRKCGSHGVNMSCIAAISRLSRAAAEENYTLEQYEAELQRIRATSKIYSLRTLCIGAGLACGGVCVLFGGDWVAAFYTALCAAIGYRVRVFILTMQMNPFADISVAAFVSTLCAYWMHFLPGTHTPWHIMIACSLFLVPSAALINAVNDLINYFIMAGTARAIKTLLVCGAMTIGIVAAIYICRVEDFTRVSTIPDTSYYAFAIAAGMTSIGLAFLFHVPERLVLYTAVGGAIAVCVRNALFFEANIDMATSSLVGASAASIAALGAIRYLKIPISVLTVPAVIPMIPGVHLFRLLFSILHVRRLDVEGLLLAVQNGVEAILGVIGIAVGAAIPVILAAGKAMHL
ncbi:MAG: threonine/serine exporter family protein, partial [Oscillospiraceae bacterium]|nr:threonine/serine exporter family protein [Oscillospiraceae bacterium]